MTMLKDYLSGKRGDVANYQVDLLCTFMQNMKMLTDLMDSDSFVPVSRDPVARHTCLNSVD